VGTGDQGKVFRVTGAGRGELYYDTASRTITGLAVDSEGRVLARTEPNGILYRISAKDKAVRAVAMRACRKSRAIVPMPMDGVRAALGGSVAKRRKAPRRPRRAWPPARARPPPPPPSRSKPEHRPR